MGAAQVRHEGPPRPREQRGLPVRGIPPPPRAPPQPGQLHLLVLVHHALATGVEHAEGAQDGFLGVCSWEAEGSGEPQGPASRFTQEEPRARGALHTPEEVDGVSCYRVPRTLRRAKMEVRRWTGLEGDWDLGAEAEDTWGWGGVQAGCGGSSSPPSEGSPPARSPLSFSPKSVRKTVKLMGPFPSCSMASSSSSGTLTFPGGVEGGQRWTQGPRCPQEGSGCPPLLPSQRWRARGSCGWGKGVKGGGGGGLSLLSGLPG